MVDSPSAQPVDEETAAALTLFNEYLNADREREQRERRLRKAEKAKDEAAAAVRKLEGSQVSAEDKAQAEAEYRRAAEHWKLLRDGKEPEEPATRADTDEPTTRADTDEPATRADTDEPTDEPATRADTDEPTDEPATRADTDEPTTQPDEPEGRAGEESQPEDQSPAPASG